MNKPAKPEADDLEPFDDGLGPIPTEAEMDAWFECNREAIDASLIQARQELADGKALPWDPEEIMAEVREQLRKEGR